MESLRAWILAGLCAATISGAARGAVRVVQYTTGYQQGIHWDLSETSRITILRASNPNWGPYDFDCYDDATSPPYDPAAIQGITAVANIGTVEIKVRQHQNRPWGATEVRLLQLDQQGVNGRIMEFYVEGPVGADGETRVATIVGSFFARSPIVSDVHIQTVDQNGSFEPWVMDADLYVEGPGPHLGSINIHGLIGGHQIDVTGALAGSLLIGEG
jgi:hypothetical protein